MNYLVKAIKKLKPSAEFVMENNDYDLITWHVLEGEAPTKKEINDAIEAIQKEEKEIENLNLTKKNEALKKLNDLGITKDDLLILGIS